MVSFFAKKVLRETGTGMLAAGVSLAIYKGGEAVFDGVNSKIDSLKKEPFLVPEEEDTKEDKRDTEYLSMPSSISP